MTVVFINCSYIPLHAVRLQVLRGGAYSIIAPPAHGGTRRYAVSLKPASLALCHLCTSDHLSVCSGQFVRRSTISFGPNFREEFSLAPCHCCKTFLQAAANLLQGPQFPLLSSFGPPRRPAAGFRPLGRFFIVLEDFTAASSVWTSRCSI